MDRPPREMALRLKNEVCRKFGTYRVYSDQFEGHSWRQLARDVGLDVRLVPWTGGDGEGSKADRFSRVRRMMLDGQVEIREPELISELRAVRWIPLPGGSERIEVPRTKAGHGDRVSAFVLAASEALTKRPQLPPQWERLEERIEREEREFRFQQAVTAVSCGGGGAF